MQLAIMTNEWDTVPTPLNMYATECRCQLGETHLFGTVGVHFYA